MGIEMKYINGENVKAGDVIIHKDEISTSLNYIIISKATYDKVTCFREDTRLPFTIDNVNEFYLIKRESDILLDGIISNLELLRYKIEDGDETLNAVIGLLKKLR